VVGALPALAFPAPSWWWLAWVGVVPLLLVVRAAPTAREGGVRAWCGLAGYVLTTQYWLLPRPGNSAPRSRCKTRRLAEAQFRTAHKPSPPRLCHRLGPRDMPLVAKRFRHVAVAIPQLVVHLGIAVSPRQQSP
jgi:hypothetical protein